MYREAFSIPHILGPEGLSLLKACQMDYLAVVRALVELAAAQPDESGPIGVFWFAHDDVRRRYPTPNDNVYLVGPEWTHQALEAIKLLSKVAEGEPADGGPKADAEVTACVQTVNDWLKGELIRFAPPPQTNPWVPDFDFDVQTPGSGPADP